MLKAMVLKSKLISETIIYKHHKHPSLFTQISQASNETCQHFLMASALTVSGLTLPQGFTIRACGIDSRDMSARNSYQAQVERWILSWGNAFITFRREIWLMGEISTWQYAGFHILPPRLLKYSGPKEQTNQSIWKLHRQWWYIVIFDEWMHLEGWQFVVMVKGWIFALFNCSN